MPQTLSASPASWDGTRADVSAALARWGARRQRTSFPLSCLLRSTLGQSRFSLG
jgi:hypothetical protein